MEYIFQRNSIVIGSYKYPGSSMNPRGTIIAKDIEEIDITQFPPVVKLKKELIFISANYLEQLTVFANQNSIRILERFDIWGAILEPFLDTELNQKSDDKNINELIKYGIDINTINQLRNRFGKLMIRFNAIFWDEFHLGQVDLLDALKLSCKGRLFYKKYYWEIMSIALKTYQ